MDMAHKGDSVIYVRGVHGQEMKSVLQFMYYGQATLYQDRMNSFLNVAKSLEVKEISKDVDGNASEPPQNYESNEYNKFNEANVDEQEGNEEQSHITKEIERMVTDTTKYKNENGSFSCSKCEKQFVTSENLNKHIKSVHEGKRYPCSRCNKSFSQNVTLQNHIKSFHEGVRYQCDMCDHTYSYENKLYRHKKESHLLFNV